jgi:uncharacterized protein (TIGR02996 family)
MNDLKALLKAVLSHPTDDAVRGMLRAELIAADCWDWPTLLGFVRAYPDADGPRLLAADWLEADGQTARAGFIRVQCALAALGREYPDASASRPEFDDLLAAQTALTRVIGPDLAQGVVPLTHVGWEPTEDGGVLITGGGAEIEYERGFASRCLMDSGVFLARAGELFRTNPISYVRLTDKMPVRIAEGWWWADSCPDPTDPIARSGYLPPELYAALHEADPSGRRSGSQVAAYLTFPTQEAAVAALCDACLRYGQGLAASDPLARERVREPGRLPAVCRTGPPHEAQPSAPWYWSAQAYDR